MANPDAAVWSPGWRSAVLNRLQQSSPEQWDLIVVGGGITGAGIYREAVHRGLKVLLLEQRDFAWGTSSRSSKMVHGGLRYLSRGHAGLARHSVEQRQRLLDELPGLVEPLPFVFSHYQGGFPGPWLFDKLLAVYDWMAGKRYRHYQQQHIKECWVPGVQDQGLKGITRFTDAVTDDARLVMRVLHDGNGDGGTALNYIKAIDTLRHKGQVVGLRIQDQQSGETLEVRADAVINATGAWTDQLRQSLGCDKVIRPLRGSHLVVPFWRLPVAFSMSVLHPVDGRPVFVYPWEGVTVIGTTDLDHAPSLDVEASITPAEVEYLLAIANHQFPQSRLVAQDVRASWAGVRPVVSETGQHGGQVRPSDETREHAIWDDSGLISVAGGKLTTYRLIALEVLNRARPYIQKALSLREEAWSETTHFQSVQIPSVFARQCNAHQQKRLLGRYGNAAHDMMATEYSAHAPTDRIGTTDTCWAELIWSCQNESVQHLDDLLLRRTRLGLLLADGAMAYLPDIKAICHQYLGWDDARWASECSRYQNIMRCYYSLPEQLARPRTVASQTPSGEPKHERE